MFLPAGEGSFVTVLERKGVGGDGGVDGAFQKGEIGRGQSRTLGMRLPTLKQSRLKSGRGDAVKGEGKRLKGRGGGKGEKKPSL